MIRYGGAYHLSLDPAEIASAKESLEQWGGAHAGSPDFTRSYPFGFFGFSTDKRPRPGSVF